MQYASRTSLSRFYVILSGRACFRGHDLNILKNKLCYNNKYAHLNCQNKKIGNIMRVFFDEK